VLFFEDISFLFKLKEKEEKEEGKTKTKVKNAKLILSFQRYFKIET